MLYVCRSKRCGFIVDSQEGEGGRGSGSSCPECVILASCLRDSLNIIAQPEVTQESPRKKRGRPKGSKTKQDPEDDDQHKKVVKSQKEPPEIQPENPEVEDMESFQDDSEDYSPSPDSVKKPKFQAPPLPKPAKHRDKRHVCSVCSKSFSTKQDLKIHSRTHSGKTFPPSALILQY